MYNMINIINYWMLYINNVIYPKNSHHNNFFYYFNLVSIGDDEYSLNLLWWSFHDVYIRLAKMFIIIIKSQDKDRTFWGLTQTTLLNPFCKIVSWPLPFAVNRGLSLEDRLQKGAV